MEIIEEEQKHPADLQNEVYSMKMMMKVEDEHRADSQNEVDSMMIMTGRLSSMLKEQKGGSASMELSIITSKATGEKEMKLEVKKL
jgi:hypothetical protein